ncbi:MULTISPECIES: DUF6276 family protein [Haloferax]|uniref:Small CPxCG-related zinc finger protein n=2 Tax=Haloferax gibbonsii TaxID=35746 RepID=A0A0K1IPJ0_HALGI|nr:MULTISPECIES: DUF6276 family protein [Haloferax]AKU06472.1 hypothetical protein ABY42_01445 [Haloferax gibbonsii]ELZ83846.1 hypothetical protein C454_06032 [Haloferax gibbonsii ATCC 33959]QOS10469.1 small CPxCG-related zinc finger protein [Haloferax gibbonsii]RDZ54300.1 hypothetical protein C5C07_01830 [Haloferax sp. Atlit-4N]REA06044.1 hypothetical protein DEQ92_07250 [Haloferax sp. Atlit-6N]
MSCPDCDGELAVFAVPEPLESHAPEAALTVGLCAGCLRLHPAETAPTDGDSRPLADVLPEGDAGASVALLVGMLDSLALNRAGIVDCVEFAERSGIDVHLTLDRLQREAADPHFDVARRQAQLDAFL